MTPENDHILRRALYEEGLSNDSAVVFVAEDGDKIIGVMAGKVSERPGGTPSVVGLIQVAFVREGWRRRGVCTALASRLLDFFECKGVEDIHVRYVVGNREAQSCWRGLGFEPTICTANTRPIELRPRLAARPH